MQRNTSHSRVSEIHSSTVTPTHASELVIDRAVGAMMAREAEEKGRARQRVAHLHKNRLFRR